MRKSRVIQPVQYNGATAERVLMDVEIEVRRLIIEYQRRVLAPPPWENQNAGTPATNTVSVAATPSPSEESAVAAAPTAAPAKKKKKLAELISDGDQLPGQISIDDVIPDENATVSDESIEAPQQHIDQTPPSPPEPAPQTFFEKIADRQLALLERRADRKDIKQYYKSAAFQVKCSIEPLEELLNFIHERLGE